MSSPSTGEPVNYVTEQEYAEREAARPPATGSGLTLVENEQQFDAALTAGKSIKLKGVVSLTTPKQITNRCQWIEGPGVIEFSLDHHAPTTVPAITIAADDCRFENFKLRSTAPTDETNVLFAMMFADNMEAGHRTVLRGLDVGEGWNRCLSKQGGPGSPYLEDILIERCHFHSFSAYPMGAGIYLNFGLRRLIFRDSQVTGRVGSETHLTGNAITTGANCEDCVFERVHCSNVDRMGLESTIVPYSGAPDTFNIRPIFRDVLCSDCGGFGVSVGHAKEFFLSNVKIRRVMGIGIELASQVADPSWGQCVDFDIDEVGSTGYATGISVDKVIDTLISGGSLKRVSSQVSGSDNGIQVYESQRCIVQGVDFTDAGTRMVFVQQGAGPNTGGFHLIQNNNFRNTFDKPGATGRAIMVYNITAAVRNNVVWQKPGTTLINESICNAPARVECDAAAPVMGGGFTGSNKIYTSA